MDRMLVKIIGLVLGTLALLAAFGCQEDKTVTVQEHEQVHESDPEMASPGEVMLVE